MKNILIHIGLPKTGSSAIQDFLNSSKNELLKKGFFYPKAGFLEKKATAQHHLAFSLLSSYPGWVKNIDGDKDFYYDELISELNNTNFDLAILSSEAFSSIKDIEVISWMRQKLSNFNVKIIMYIRRPDLWLESWYAQVVKEYPYVTQSPEVFISNNKIVNFKTIYLFEEIFGRKNIVVRPYEKVQLLNGDIISDFLNIFECDHPSPKLKSKKNVSPMPGVIELLRNLNEEKNVPNIVRKKLYSKIIHAHQNDLSLSNFGSSIFTPEQRRDIYYEYNEEFKLIANKFLPENKGNLFYDIKDLQT